MSTTAPTTLAAALDMLAADPSTTVVAGGTDLMVAVNFGHRRPESFLALRRVDELREHSEHDGLLRIGAGTTYRALEHGPVGAAIPVLAMAARTVGSPQIRNAGTLGGNLATGSPAGDTLPVLLALDATVQCASASGHRALPIAEFLLGPKRTALAPGELVTAVDIPFGPTDSVGPDIPFGPDIPSGPDIHEFVKVGTRNAMVISVVSVALVASSATGTAGIGLGSVGPTPLRAPTAEAWMRDHVDWAHRTVDGDLDAFVAAVRADARPISDHRATAEYRRHAIGVCARRALERAVQGR